MKLAPSDIREFVERDRGVVQQAKRDYWARLARTKSGANVALSHALYLHLKEISPGYPSQRSRDEDFAHHVRLKGLIDRASRSISIRSGSR